MYEQEVKVMEIELAISGQTNSVHVPKADNTKRLHDDLCRGLIIGPTLTHTWG